MITGHAGWCRRSELGPNVGIYCSHCGNEVKYVREPLVTGEQLYNAFREAWNKAAARRVHQAGLPRWKALKPWVTKVWNEAADIIDKEAT